MVDGIYPEHAVFIDAIANAEMEKETGFSAAQEGFRKEIERALGVIISHFQISERPLRFWFPTDIAFVVHGCVTMHNVVVEHRREKYDSAFLEGMTATFSTRRSPPGSVSILKTSCHCPMEWLRLEAAESLRAK